MARTWDEEPPASDRWHDHSVWGLAWRGGSGDLGDWTGELEMDLDRILDCRWVGEERHYRIAPAFVVFRAVTDLRISLDWKSQLANGLVHPAEIHSVTCDQAAARPAEALARQWQIRFEWPPGEISFLATGYREELRAGPVVLIDRYTLPVEQRRDLLRRASPDRGDRGPSAD